MFVACGLAMLAAQALLLVARVRRSVNARWIAATFGASAAGLGLAAYVPDAARRILARFDDRAQHYQIRAEGTAD